MSLEGLFEWSMEQVRYILFFVMVIILLVCAFKRAWLLMIGSIFAFAFIGIFVIQPESITDMSEWLGGILDFGA